MAAGHTEKTNQMAVIVFGDFQVAADLENDPLAMFCGL